MDPDEQDLRDIKPPEDLPFYWPDLLPYAIIALVALGLFALAWWWTKRKKGLELPPIPALPPDQSALNALRIHVKRYEQGEINRRKYGFSASETLRIFIEARYGVNATDLTTLEIKKSLQKTNMPNAEINDLIALLTRADAVKFSDIDVAEDVASFHRIACDFIVRHRPVTPTIPEEAHHG